MSLVVATVLAVSALVPGAALAAPSPDSCASSRAVPFTIPVPDAMRTSGTHRFEWYATWVNPDGSTGESLTGNQITIDASAPVYPNTVLLRIVRNVTQLADGSVVVVESMRPSQDARLYAAAFGGPADELFLSSFRMWLRYETSKNRWTPFVELDRGPETSVCNQVTSSTFKKAYGWD